MCRWIAYRGETTSFEPYVTEPEHSLIAQSIRSLQSTAGSNGDGFGLGWYGEHPEPGLYRETRPAWSDDNLRYLCISAVICARIYSLPMCAPPPAPP
jgi:glutamine amidotransferase